MKMKKQNQMKNLTENPIQTKKNLNYSIGENTELKEENIIDEQKKLNEEYQNQISENEIKKETRGRKKGSTKKLNNDVENYASQYKGILSLGLNIIVKRLTPNNELSQDEITQLDFAFEELLKKYIPLISNYKEETGLLIVLLVVFVPRIKFYADEKKRLKKENETIKET